MTRTYAQIQQQISKLQKEAEALKSRELAGVIARIQEAIAHYGLSARDLFGDGAAKAPGRRRAAAAPAKATDKPTEKRARKPAEKKPPSPPKYRDETGRTWTGVGKRPQWFKAAIEAGKTPQDLEIKP